MCAKTSPRNRKHSWSGITAAALAVLVFAFLSLGSAAEDPRDEPKDFVKSVSPTHHLDLDGGFKQNITFGWRWVRGAVVKVFAEVDPASLVNVEDVSNQPSQWTYYDQNGPALGQNTWVSGKLTDPEIPGSYTLKVTIDVDYGTWIYKVNCTVTPVKEIPIYFQGPKELFWDYRKKGKHPQSWRLEIQVSLTLAGWDEALKEHLKTVFTIPTEGLYKTHNCTADGFLPSSVSGAYRELVTEANGDWQDLPAWFSVFADISVGPYHLAQKSLGTWTMD